MSHSDVTRKVTALSHNLAPPARDRHHDPHHTAPILYPWCRLPSLRPTSSTATTATINSIMLAFGWYRWPSLCLLTISLLPIASSSSILTISCLLACLLVQVAQAAAYQLGVPLDLITVTPTTTDKVRHSAGWPANL